MQIIKRLVFVLLIWTIKGSTIAQSIMLPGKNQAKQTASSPTVTPQKSVLTKKITFTCNFDGVFILTNPLDAKVSKKIIVSNGSTTEPIPHGTFKVELRDVKGNLYQGDKYLDVNAQLAQVKFARTSDGFTIQEISEQDIMEQQKEARKRLVKSIIDSHYNGELKSAASKKTVESASAKNTVYQLKAQGIFTDLQLNEFNDLVTLIDRSHVLYYRLSHELNSQKESFLLNKDNFKFIGDVHESLDLLESKNKDFMEYWTNPGYFNIISEDIYSYIRSIRTALSKLPKSESAFIELIESTQLNAQKKNIAKERIENQSVATQPLNLSVPNITEVDQNTDSQQKVKPNVEDEPTSKWYQIQFWGTKQWSITIGVLGVVLIVLGILVEEDIL
jgi:hypothetical protein